MASSFKDLKNRLSTAWASAKTLRRVWKSKLREATKVFLFQSLISTILLYGSETWIMGKGERQRLFNGYNSLLRYALDIHFQTHTKTVDVYARAQIPRPAYTLTKRILKFNHGTQASRANRS